MAFTVSIDIIQCIIAEGKSCGGIVVWNMSRSKNKIKSLVENIFIIFYIIIAILKSFLHKLTVNKEMQTALHSSNLQAYGYVSFNEEPFAQSTLDLFPKDCNISKGLIIQILSSDTQLFPIDYEITNSDKVTKSSLYKFIVDTFHLKRIGSNEPVINLNFKILYKKSYSFYKAKFHYMYKFSAKPTSGININGMFDLEMPHNIKKN